MVHQTKLVGLHTLEGEAHLLIQILESCFHPTKLIHFLLLLLLLPVGLQVVLPSAGELNDSFPNVGCSPK